MPDNEWMAVRCCCSPERVFGFLKVPRSLEGDRYRVVDIAGVIHEVKIKPYCEIPVAMAPPIQISLIPTGAMEKEAAIYSDDRPIEFWRSIKGFVEVQRDPAE